MHKFSIQKGNAESSSKSLLIPGSLNGRTATMVTRKEHSAISDEEIVVAKGSERVGAASVEKYRNTIKFPTVCFEPDIVGPL